MKVPGRSLAARLLFAMSLVALVGAITTGIIAAVVGPRLFHVYLEDYAGADHELTHVAGEAFGRALAVSGGVALVAALMMSVLVSLFLTRRIARSLRSVRRAATAIADGNYAARVPDVGMGSEFDELARGFNTMAEELSRIERTRTRLLSDLGHEMRTPVATLDGYLEGIQDGVITPDGTTVALLRDQVARLARLAQDISTVTTAEEGRLSMRRESVTVGRLLTAAVAQAAPRCVARGIALYESGAEHVRALELWVDVGRIGQVLTNLLDNALQHTPPGGHIRLGATHEDGAVRLTVADDGDGIAPEHLSYIFERFYRMDTARDRAHGGSGIGLALSRAIVEAHGGTVRATSPGLGQGTTLVVHLPIGSADNDTAQSISTERRLRPWGFVKNR